MHPLLVSSHFYIELSATHKEAHNPIYVHDALMRSKELVKKISQRFELKNLHGTDKYVYLEDIILSQTEGPKHDLALNTINF
jgi:type III restriction enzyme